MHSFQNSYMLFNKYRTLYGLSFKENFHRANNYGSLHNINWNFTTCWLTLSKDLLILNTLPRSDNIGKVPKVPHDNEFIWRLL